MSRYYTPAIRHMLQKIDECIAALPDGPRREIRELHRRALVAGFGAHGPPEQQPENKLLGIIQRAEQMYADELRLHGVFDGSVEKAILVALLSAFTVNYGPVKAHELFALFAKPQYVPPKAKAARPRGHLKDKRIFVRAFLQSGQKQYSFAKRVAKLNAAVPPEERFGCNSTTREEVETALERALEEWGDIIRNEMSPAQK